MTLSERLKEAEAARWARDHPFDPPPVVDLRTPDEPAIDLTDPASNDGITYTTLPPADEVGPVEDVAVDEDRRSAIPCPRCGGPTQIDLVDQVNQTQSLSCTRCFHMFRIEL